MSGDMSDGTRQRIPTPRDGRAFAAILARPEAFPRLAAPIGWRGGAPQE